MKRIGSLLIVAVFAGAITLGAYKFLFEKNNYAIISADQNTSVVNTSFTPTSAKGAGINEVDFTLAAENTVNAVVHVKNVTIGKSPNNIFEFFYGSGGSKSAPQVGTGSGVIISQDGHIVTNNHVIANASQLQVTLNNNKTYDAQLVGSDPNSDIALIKIETNEKLPYLAFGDSDNTKIGEWVLAVGNPFNLTSTVTAGIVSAKARSLDTRSNQSFIQTDAAVNPGNSGGALVNTNGDLIGINTAISVQKGVLGINVAPVNTPYAIEKGLNEIEGVYISGIVEDSGAEEAELQEGDVVKMIDQIKIRKYPDLTGYLSTKRPGDTVEMVIDRDDEEIIVAVTLKERQTIIVPEMGMEVKNLSDKDKKQFKTKIGVKITGVPERYRGYGLDGKVIIKVDDQDIENITDAKNAFGGISRYGKTVITMLNEDGERERLIFQ